MSKSFENIVTGFFLSNCINLARPSVIIVLAILNLVQLFYSISYTILAWSNVALVIVTTLD